jgi:hypothetical protein
MVEALTSRPRIDAKNMAWLSLCAAMAFASCERAEPVGVSEGGALAQQPAPGCQVQDWMVGSWQTRDQAVLTFHRDGPSLTWDYTRPPAVITQRWGEKAPAEARGTVSRIEGCRIELDGHYTAYAAISPRDRGAVGERMIYRLTYDGASRLVGRGSGHGREWFDIGFVRCLTCSAKRP